MELLQLIRGHGAAGMPAMDGGPWPSVTVTLSVLIVASYCLIAFNWYFQSKVSSRGECRAALTQLGMICAAGAIGAALWVMDVPWVAWRGYDILLILLAAHTWLFVIRMRGVALIDERLALTAELEQQAMRYREIAELLPHMIWTASADGTVDFCNQRWREYRGDDSTWLEAAHPQDLPDATASWSRAVAERQPFSMDVRLGGSQGYRTFQIKAAPIVRGEVVKWLGACADIEDQRLLALEKEVQAKQKSFFLNALSHDLRAPLHNVLLNAHLLKMSPSEPADSETLNTIVENASAAGDLVTRLLDFAKVGAHEQAVNERVALPALLKQVVRRFQSITREKNLSLAVEPGDVIELSTDRHKLERIVSNLVDNSIKYTHSGGVTLAVVAQEGSVCIRVSDTGVGVPPEHVPYLFDEFYQVNNYERDRNKGFGMGLAICRSLARQIDAGVRLARTGPGGSCFEIVIRRVGADRRGRSRGAADDRGDSEEARLCRV